MSGEKTHTAETSDTEADTYLVFSLQNSLYATQLLGVREVVEFKEPKELPNTNAAFLGVINIRGEIIAVVDLSTLLGGKSSQSKRPTLLLVESDNGAVAALVDEVQSVVTFDSTQIDSALATQTAGGMILGIARQERHLVTLINLKEIIGATRIAS
jgi:purine-binding chemotaxis protein CheW